MFNFCAFAMMIVCVPSTNAKTLTYESMSNIREEKKELEENPNFNTCICYGHFAKLWSRPTWFVPLLEECYKTLNNTF
jgi:hypothetical protein